MMETNKNNELNTILQHTHNSIEPEDSWCDLRGRINHRLQDGMKSRYYNEVKKWRILCISLAACLLLVSGLLIYQVGYNAGNSHKNLPAFNANYHRLSARDIENLKTAFVNVHQLFYDESPWIVLGSNKDVIVGLNNEKGTTVNENQFVIVRLAIKAGIASSSRYFDIVTFPDKSATFQAPFTDKANMFITLKPKLVNGVIEVEYDAKINGGSNTNSTVSLDNNDFTQLVGMETTKGRVDISGMAQIVLEI